VEHGDEGVGGVAVIGLGFWFYGMEYACEDGGGEEMVDSCAWRQVF